MFPHFVTRPGVVVPVRVDPTGLAGPTPGQVRGPNWQRVASGWHRPVEVDESVVEQRIVEALAGVPPDAAVTGWGSLAWRRLRWFNGLAGDGRTRLPVPVALQTRGVRPRAGVEFTEDWLFDDDIEVVDGLPVVRVERAVSFEVCRSGSLISAIRAIDMACAADATDLVALRAYALRLAGRPGVTKLRRALDWADENVWSPKEVDLRILWLRRHPVGLMTNRPLFDLDGRHLLTPDVIDPVAGVLGEYNGAVHLDDPHRRVDLDRDDLCRELGLEVVTMMSSLHDDVARFVRRLDAAYRRTTKRAESTRRWTLEQPRWWVDTSTVALRSALSDAERSRWLRRLAL